MLPGHQGEDPARCRGACGGPACLYQHEGQDRADEGEHEAQGQWGSQAERCNQQAGDEGHHAHAEVPGEFVQARGQAALPRACSVDHHVHGHRPRQGLLNAEQDVDEDHGRPVLGQQQHQRDGPGEYPPGAQHGESPVTVSECAHRQIPEGLGDAEAGDEGQGRPTGGQVEDIFCQQWNQGAFQADHAAHEEVGQGQQPEEGWQARRTHRSSRATFRISAALMGCSFCWQRSI